MHARKVLGSSGLHPQWRESLKFAVTFMLVFFLGLILRIHQCDLLIFPVRL